MHRVLKYLCFTTLMISTTVQAQLDWYLVHFQELGKLLDSAVEQKDIEVFRGILLSDDLRENLRKLAPAISENELSKRSRTLWEYSIIQAARLNDQEINSILANAYEVDPNEIVGLPIEDQLHESASALVFLCWTPFDPSYNLSDYVSIEIAQYANDTAKIQIDVSGCGRSEYQFEKRKLPNEEIWIATSREVLQIY